MIWAVAIGINEKLDTNLPLSLLPLHLILGRKIWWKECATCGSFLHGLLVRGLKFPSTKKRCTVHPYDTLAQWHKATTEMHAVVMKSDRFWNHIGQQRSNTILTYARQKQELKLQQQYYGSINSMQSVDTQDFKSLSFKSAALLWLSVCFCVKF